MAVRRGMMGTQRRKGHQGRRRSGRGEVRGKGTSGVRGREREKEGSKGRG